MNEIRHSRKRATSSEVLPEKKKKGNISIVEQSLNKPSFSHPKVRKEGLKLEQAQRRVAWMAGRTGSLLDMEEQKYLGSLHDAIQDCVV